MSSKRQKLVLLWEDLKLLEDLVHIYLIFITQIRCIYHYSLTGKWRLWDAGAWMVWPRLCHLSMTSRSGGKDSINLQVLNPSSYLHCSFQKPQWRLTHSMRTRWMMIFVSFKFSFNWHGDHTFLQNEVWPFNSWFLYKSVGVSRINHWLVFLTTTSTLSNLLCACQWAES